MVVLSDTLQREIHENAMKKGFWTVSKNIPEKLCLIHSEVSEALEAVRADEPIGEELADIVIRCFDLAEHLGVKLCLEVFNKHRRNLSRPHLHGKKF